MHCSLCKHKIRRGHPVAQTRQGATMHSACYFHMKQNQAPPPQPRQYQPRPTQYQTRPYQRPPPVQYQTRPPPVQYQRPPPVQRVMRHPPPRDVSSDEESLEDSGADTLSGGGLTPYDLSLEGGGHLPLEGGGESPPLPTLPPHMSSFNVDMFMTE